MVIMSRAIDSSKSSGFTPATIVCTMISVSVWYTSTASSASSFSSSIQLLLLSGFLSFADALCPAAVFFGSSYSSSTLVLPVSLSQKLLFLFIIFLYPVVSFALLLGLVHFSYFFKK